MEANELRVNNFVEIEMNTGWRLRKVRGYDIYNIHGIDEYDKANYRPIPLTEEWLLKFGFEIIDEVINKCYRKQLFKGDGYMDYLSIIDRGVYIFMLTSNYGKESVLANPPKYVHQLQNLYFALTGEELQTSVVNME